MSSSPFSDVHDDLRTVARDLLRGSAPTFAGGTPADADWTALVRAGWPGLEIPAALDGAGATLAEVAVVLRELGRAACVSPYLGSAVLGVGALAELTPTAPRDDLLRKLAVGRERVAVALASEEDLADRAPVRYRVTDVDGAVVVRGSAGFVPDAAEADALLLPVTDRDGVPSLAYAPAGTPGLRVDLHPLVDSSRRLARVTADGLRIPHEALWRFAGDPDRAMAALQDRAAFAVACDSLGLAEAVLDATVEYASSRHQFGRPIGSFQAVKHACADMLVQTRLAEVLVSTAEEAVRHHDEDAWVPVAMAKLFVGGAAVDIAGRAVQLHGGIGYTWERGLHAYLKRAVLNRSLFGSPAALRRRLAARYGAAG